MVRQRIFLDTSWWDQGDESLPHLQTLYQAVWQDRRISLRYRPLPMTEIELVVDPYGLVAKAGAWYLVSYHNARIRVHRLTDILEVRVLETTFERSEAFDLQEFWTSWCQDQGRWRANYVVRVRVMPAFIPWLPMFFGSRIREQVAQAGPTDAQGRIMIELTFESLESARNHLLGCGGGVEVLTPRALRLSIQDYARQIWKQYKNSDL